MDGFKIIGGKKLKGEVVISGAKNAALPIMLATLVEEGEYQLDNVPDLKDIKTTVKLLRELGVDVEQLSKNSYKITNKGLREDAEAPYDLVKTMRASFLVMGPMLSNIKKSKVSLPGGCAIGARPVDYHLKGFEKLGAKIIMERGYVEAVATELHGAEIYLDFPSVGATENIIMAAVKASGETVIENAAREPEIEDLCNFLNKMGAKISGIGSSKIIIEGVKKLKPCRHSIIPDRIEAGTFMIASLISGGEIVIKDANLDHLDSFKIKLEEMGAKVSEDEDGIRVRGNIADLKQTRIATMPYPGYPTDLQAQVMVLMALINGSGEIKETIFENRFMHTPELNRMGANISIDEKIAIIKGVEHFSGAEVMASDLRAGASLVLAALSTPEETIINRIYHIDRGYEAIEDKLKNLGADIERVRTGVI